MMQQTIAGNQIRFCFINIEEFLDKQVDDAINILVYIEKSHQFLNQNMSFHCSKY